MARAGPVKFVGRAFACYSTPMLRAAPANRILAFALAALAGFVDSIGYIELGGYFVSFASGNSTRLGIDLARHPARAAIAGALIAAFVAGAMLGSVIGRGAGGRRTPAVVLLVAALLTLAAALHMRGLIGLGAWTMAVAMGSVNAVFERDGEVRIGVTSMTGTLVKVGQRLAGAAFGGSPWAWAPHAVQWLCLIAGATLGALALDAFGVGALWTGAGFALVCGLGAFFVGDD